MALHAIAEPPVDMFGKLMRVSDELMWRYFELLSFRPLAEIEGFGAEVADGLNPMEVKFRLADEIVTRFHGAAAAARAKADFIARHRHGQMPEEMEECTVSSSEPFLGIGQLLREAGLVASSSEGLRMVRQGAVRRDGQPIDDPGASLEVDGTTAVYQVGKRRFARVTLRRESASG